MTHEPGARDDAALTAAVLAGEERAFTELMGRHKAPLYRFIRRYVGDADEAYDLTQETFVAVWSSLKGFDRTRSFETWLRRIALNKCRDWARRRQVRSFFFRAATLDAETDRLAGPDASSDGDDPARLSALNRAIAALPRQLKEPLILTHFDGMSHHAAGEVLGVTAKAIETRVYRAKQAIMKSIAMSGEG